MAKLSQAQIDAIPGLAAAQRNGDVVFLNLDTDDTAPKRTAGFLDEQIREMSKDQLNAMLVQIGEEEQRLHTLLADVNRRRNETNQLIQRKAELS